MKFEWHSKVMAFVVITFFLVLVAGCTLHFKGKEVELDTQANLTFELHSASLFDG